MFIWMWDKHPTWIHRQLSCHSRRWQLILFRINLSNRWGMRVFVFHRIWQHCVDTTKRFRFEFVHSIISCLFFAYVWYFLLQSVMQPLAPADRNRSQSNTNLSTTLSLSVLDQNGNELPFHTDTEQPIELIIPRDPNAVVPPVTLQNVTALGSSPHSQLFNLHSVNITSSNNPNVSVHMEMYPLNRSLGYSLIYKFDSPPQLNSSLSRIDGWSLFCPSSEYLLGGLARKIKHVFTFSVEQWFWL